MGRFTTCPLWRIMNSSNWNSRAVSSIFLPLRMTRRVIRSSSRSASFSLVLASALPFSPRLARAGGAVDARQHLRHVIRLGQVIVAAGAKAGDAIVDVAERAQYENRHLAPRRRPAPGQGAAIP